jgi:tripartite-type tricarboxylate transporter receptor subunit TctC
MNQITRRGARRSIGVVGLGALALGLPAVMMIGLPSAHAASLRSAAPDTSFYKGKTISWDVPDGPGTGFYDSAAILAPVVGKYLGATVNIVSIPAGGTIAGQDQAAAASNNGLTMGTINVSTDVGNEATKQPGVNFNIQKEALIAGLPINPEVFVVSPSSPYKTWDALVKAAPKTQSVAVPGSNEVLEKGVYLASGIQAKMITGYEDPPSEVAGFLRGDAVLGANSVPTFASAISGGKARPLLLTGPVPAGTEGSAQLKSTPTLASYYASHKLKSASQTQAIDAMEALFGQKAVNQAYFMPAGTDPGKVAALTAAFQSAMASSAVKASFIKQNLTPGFFDQAQVVTAIATAVKEESAISKAASSYPY